uniref:F-box associated beta-propeller type 1 domain-containing protein n=2 Tax=Chenopodium quinoa TaxID=63459 RepID=A0A803L5F8_CHEQI
MSRDDKSIMLLDSQAGVSRILFADAYALLTVEYWKGAMEIGMCSNPSFDPLTLSGDDEYFSAESSLDIDLPAEFIDGDDELAAGFYFSLPDLWLPEFDYELTEPLCPPMSDHDFLLFYSLDPRVSGLVLIPKHSPQRPQFEYVSLIQSQTKVPDISFLNSLNLQILQSCSGLLLCLSQSSQKYYVCNLATQHPEVLPNFVSATNHFALNLAFDPYTSPYYKIICVQKLELQKPLHQISIYSRETQTWAVSGKPFVAPGDIDFSDGVFCNGAIHWMRRTTIGLYFNVEEEILTKMPKPPLKEGYPLVSCEYFGESQGHLHYVVASPELSFLELFEMKEDYSGWFLRSLIDLKALAKDFPIMARRSSNPHPFLPRYECDVLSVVQGHYDEDLEVVLSIPGEVITYNHEKRSAKKLCDLKVRPYERAVWYRVYSSYQVL